MRYQSDVPPGREAEDRIHIRLQRMHLVDDMFREVAIIFHSGMVVKKEELLRGMLSREPRKLQFTVPDFTWLPPKKIAVYLDGPVHKQKGVANRDDAINQLLINLRWTVMRCPYRPPLTRMREIEICEEIREEISMQAISGAKRMFESKNVT